MKKLGMTSLAALMASGAMSWVDELSVVSSAEQGRCDKMDISPELANPFVQGDSVSVVIKEEQARLVSA